MTLTSRCRVNIINLKSTMPWIEALRYIYINPTGRVHPPPLYHLLRGRVRIFKNDNLHRIYNLQQVPTWVYMCSFNKKMVRQIVCVLDGTVGHVRICWDYVSIFIYKNSNYNKINQIYHYHGYLQCSCEHRSVKLVPCSQTFKKSIE